VGEASSPNPSVPKTIPKIPIASKIPSALPRCLGGNVSDIIENVAGIKQPNPTPEIARMINNCPKSCVRPQTAVQIPHNPVPIKITFFREYRSAAYPQNGALSACKMLLTVPIVPKFV